jgi:alpha-N-acetylglucosamine transferase
VLSALLLLYLSLKRFGKDEQGEGRAFVTLLYGEEFLNATLVLLYSLRRSGTTVEILVMVAGPLSQRSQHQLTDVLGATLVFVEPIPNPWARSQPARASLALQFTKLRLWQLASYQNLIYLDSDMVVLRNIDSLFDLAHNISNAAGNALAAVNEFTVDGHPFADSFNAGLLVMRPSGSIFTSMQRAWPTANPNPAMEQHFLNNYFANRWMPLPYIYNCPSRLYLLQPEIWNDNIRVLHYVGAKPWDRLSAATDLRMSPVMDFWHRIFAEFQSMT